MIGVLLVVMEPDVTTASCPYKPPQKKTEEEEEAGTESCIQWLLLKGGCCSRGRFFRLNTEQNTTLEALPSGSFFFISLLAVLLNTEAQRGTKRKL